MNQEHLGSPKEFAGTIFRHLADHAERMHALPSEADIAALIETIFFASLYEEEARRTQFSVAWQPGTSDCTAVVAMTTRVRITPANLAKLAPATQHEATSIAVRREGGDLVAWALLERDMASASPLTIRALAPGVLRVDYAGIPYGLYTRGTTLLAGGPHEVKSPARLLTQVFPRWCAEADPSVHIDLRSAVLTRIAARALAHGHGGMILLVPADVAAPDGVRVHYPVGEGSDVLAKRYAEVTRDVAVGERLERLRASRPRGVDGRTYVRDEAQIAFAEAIERIARLTAIDNALLMDTDLNLRGFGVQVIEADAPQAQFRHVNPYSDDVHVDDLATFKGTRHPAGVIFCTRQPREAAAIIASQDGRLSLASKRPNGEVEVLGSYEHGFGWR